MLSLHRLSLYRLNIYTSTYRLQHTGFKYGLRCTSFKLQASIYRLLNTDLEHTGLKKRYRLEIHRLERCKLERYRLSLYRLQYIGLKYTGSKDTGSEDTGSKDTIFRCTGLGFDCNMLGNAESWRFP